MSLQRIIWAFLSSLLQAVTWSLLVRGSRMLTPPCATPRPNLEAIARKAPRASSSGAMQARQLAGSHVVRHDVRIQALARERESGEYGGDSDGINKSSGTRGGDTYLAS